MDITYEETARMIDHSLLNPVLTDEAMDEGCRLAVDYGVATVCIKPYYVRHCAELLAGSSVKPTTTIGFPHGGHSTAEKVAEARAALSDGALELDMVVNIGKVLSLDWNYVTRDIAEVTWEAHDSGALIKVIFENCFLEDGHKTALCKICGEVGADFVKTSTGFGGGGATIEDVKLMRAHAPANVQVKAAGGVRNLDRLLEFRDAGATRIGATATAAILDEARRRLA